MRGREDLDGDRALAHDVEPVRVLPFLEEVGPGFEPDVRGAARDERDVIAAHPLQEGMLGEDRLHRLAAVGHRVAESGTNMFVMGHSFRRAGAGWNARASAVRSIPTGHQVMHRPQPTQPDSPNWSTHDASLWVSHCR